MLMEKINNKRFDFKSENPSKFIYTNVSIFELFVRQSMFFLSGADIFVREINLQIRQMEANMLHLDGLMSQEDNSASKSYKALQKELEVNTSQLELLKKQKVVKVEYFRLLLQMVRDKSHRTGLDLIQERIMYMFKNYKNFNMNHLQVVEAYNLENIMAAQKLKIGGMGSKQKGDVATPEEVGERRKALFATVNGRHNQFNRRRRRRRILL